MRAEHETEYVDYVRAKMAWLRRLAYLLCHDWHRADDTAQATITKLYLHWHRASRADDLDAYVRTMLVRTFLAERRTAWHRVVLGADAPEPPPVVDHDPTDAFDLRAALARLPPRQRATLVLRFFCDMSVEETAAALGCSAGTVKSQSAKAFTTMRATLSPRIDVEVGHG